MQWQDRIVLVTGAARASAAPCAGSERRGAAGIVVADLDGELARATAGELGGSACSATCRAPRPSSRWCGRRGALRTRGRAGVERGFGVKQLDLDDALSSPDAVWQGMWTCT